MPRLQRWARDRGIAWLTILSSHPSREDDLPAAKAEAFNTQRGGVPTALLLDESGTMGHGLWRRHRRPHVRHRCEGPPGLCRRHRRQRVARARQRQEAHNHVRAALEGLLAGRAVKTASTEPFGCAIAYQG